MTNKQMLKAASADAKNYGLTLARKNARLNGHPLYKLVNPAGRIVVDSMTLEQAYNRLSEGNV